MEVIISDETYISNKMIEVLRLPNNHKTADVQNLFPRANEKCSKQRYGDAEFSCPILDLLNSICKFYGNLQSITIVIIY